MASIDLARKSALADSEHWRKICQPAISGLLDHANTYTPEQKAKHLDFVSRHVTAWLGRPRPSLAHSPQTPLEVASALETSINFRTYGKPIVRFQFEPLAATFFGRTDEDPFGRKVTDRMLDDTKQLASRVDLRWTNQLMDTFYPTPGEESTTLLARERELPAPLDHAPMFNFAFDLDGGERTMKTYFLPIGKVMATNMTGHQIILEAARKLDPCGDELAPAVDLLEQYFATAARPLVVDLIGLDATDPVKSRLKIYAHLQTATSWEAVRDVCTLGGTASDENALKGLELLRSIWHLLLNEDQPLGDGQESDQINKLPRDPNSFLGSLLFSFEMSPRQRLPLVKTYVPMWQYAPSDKVIAQRLISCFTTLGWTDAARDYLPGIRNTYPGADLDGPGPALLHSNVSFSFTPTSGAYMSIYYAVSAGSVGVGMPQ